MKYIYALLFAAVLVLAPSRAQAQCQAAFTYTNNGNAFNFTDASTGNPVAWVWTFGDNTAPSTTQNPSHTYAVGGIYIVSLTISTSSFCFDTFTDTITATGGCTASYTYTMDTTTGTVQFQAAPVQNGLTYTWDFGDGSPMGNGSFTTHSYANAGTYPVCLFMNDSLGFCNDTVCDTINVIINSPGCNVSWTNTSLFTGQENFVASPFNGDWVYTWDFGDGSPFGNGALTTHTYTASGTYTVCLSVLDTITQCSSQFCDTVMVQFPVSCPVNWTNFAGLSSDQQNFTATPFNPLNTYSWDYGDGSPNGTGVFSMHTYASPGTYTVCVTMVASGGCTSTFCDTVNVGTTGMALIPAEHLRFTVSPNPVSEHTLIGYDLPSAGKVKLDICDLLGRSMDVLLDENAAEGAKRIDWDASSLPAGAYMLNLHTEQGDATLLIIRN